MTCAPITDFTEGGSNVQHSCCRETDAITGKDLYHKYVAAALCTSNAYTWDLLSGSMQARWTELAQQLRVVRPGAPTKSA